MSVNFPLVDIRKNLQNVWELQEITQIITVPSSSPYIIRLNEIPDNGSVQSKPSISGLILNDTTYTPNDGYFSVKYSTGDVIFNSSQSDQTFTIVYWGKGSLIEADDINYLYNRTLSLSSAIDDTNLTVLNNYNELINITDELSSSIDDRYNKTLHLDQITPQSVINGSPIMEGIQFNTIPVTTNASEGLLRWNSTDGTLDLGMSGGDITMQLGQEMFVKVVNRTGSDIANGKAVYFNGRLGNRPTIALAKGDSITTSRVTGITTQDILDGDEGFITTIGYVRQIKTNYTGWAAGNILWVSKTDAGELTNVEPTVPHFSDIVGSVGIVGNTGIGSILVNILRYRNLATMSDINGTPINTSGQILVWDETNKYFDFDYNINNYSQSINGTTQGQMAFWDATLNKWTYTETSELFWDDVNKRLGIGTATPAEKFEISQSADGVGLKVNGYDDKSSEWVKLNVSSSGYGGLFTSDQTTIAGRDSTDTERGFRFSWASSWADVNSVGSVSLLNWNIDFKLGDDKRFVFGSDNDFACGYHSASDTFRLNAVSSLVTANDFVMSADGNVGIGTASPGFKLDVSGIIASAPSGGGEIRSYQANGLANPTLFVSLKTDTVVSKSGLYRDNAAADKFFLYYNTATGDTGLSNVFNGANIIFNTTSSGVLTQRATILNNGNVGIGTTTPNNKLQVAGLINFDDTGYNIALGTSALFTNIGTSNVAIGYQAGYFNTTGAGSEGTSNFFLGYQAGRGSAAGNTGYSNIAIGYKSMYPTTTGYSNIAIGNNTLRFHTTGNLNIAIGESALYNSTTQTTNIGIGSSALFSVSGNFNTAIGYEAGYNANNYNTFIGYRAGKTNTGSRNLFLGFGSGYRQTTNSNLLIVDTQPRASEAEETTNAILYGVMAESPADQDLYINADTFLKADNRKLFFGTDNDMSIDYDGTNGNIKTDLVNPSDLHIDCGTEKTIVLDTVVWDDMRVTPGSFDRPGTSDPTIVSYAPNGGAISTYLWEFGKNNVASFTIQLPHSYKQGEDIHVHIHWTPGSYGVTENGNTVGWKVDYCWANINGTFSDMVTADLQDVCDGIDHQHQMTPSVSITGTDKNISSMLICNVKRTDTGTDDTWTGTLSGRLPMLLEVDFHYPIDTQGSRQIGIK